MTSNTIDETYRPVKTPTLVFILALLLAGMIVLGV